MKLEVFRSDKGDCLLIQSKDGKNVLVDGGMPASYTKYVSPTLGGMRENGEVLDLIYISHIDADHIAGVLRLLDDEIDWRIYDYRKAQGMVARKPRSQRPPDVKAIWHNSFHEQVEDNRGEIEDMLAANAALLSSLDGDEFSEQALHQQSLITSKRQAALVSRRIGSRQLNIPLNPEFGGKLMIRKAAAAPIQLGSLSIGVVGPSGNDLDDLRDDWNKWLKSQSGRKQLRKIREASEEIVDDLGNDEFKRLTNLLSLNANELGNRNNVTVPNLASLMIYVEEEGRTMVLGGDGHSDDVFEGLQELKLLRDDDTIHVDVFKVLHHGSEHNTRVEFCKAVTADHYVFCGNGGHHNPDLGIVRMIINSRLGTASQRSENPEASRPFNLWFNSSSQASDADKVHMRKIESLVKKRAASSDGKMRYRFLRTNSFSIEL